MSKRELLTQEEIEALLHVVDEGAVDADPDGPVAADVKTYDLASQDRVVKGRLPTLELVNEKFARLFKVSLNNLLRYPVDIGVGGVQIMKFSEYLQTLYVPTSINLIRVKPFAGTALAVMDAKLVFRLVDQFFGGSGTQASAEGRDFTPTESRIIRRVLECVYADLVQAWKGVLPIDIQQLGSEANPSLLNAFSANEIVLVNTYNAELDNGGGEIHLTLPYAMLEPYRELLESSGQGKASEVDKRWVPNLERRLLDARVNINCAIAERQISLKEVLRLREGDVIPIDVPDSHLVEANGVPAFMAKLGNARGNLALEFQEPYVLH
ncbi:MAG: flagellar motor switch protein FliM [Gammaproteobacteria bacterium]|nr:flagellar motor switch protein FliM [Gammaproteobacteria bacterium]